MHRFEAELRSAVAFAACQSRTRPPDRSVRLGILKRVDLAAFHQYALNRCTEDRAKRALYMAIDLKLLLACILVFDQDYLNNHVLSLAPRDSLQVTPGQMEYRSYLLTPTTMLRPLR